MFYFKCRAWPNNAQFRMFERSFYLSLETSKIFPWTALKIWLSNLDSILPYIIFFQMNYNHISPTDYYFNSC